MDGDRERRPRHQHNCHHNAEANKVTGTPTFVINGKAFPAGYQPLSTLDAAIAAARAAGAKG